MTCIYAPSSRQASRPALHTPSAKHRAARARDHVFADFPPGAARALDQSNFVDRRPDQEPRPLGKIAAEAGKNTGMKAVRHWLNQAGQADTDEERQGALKIAGEIAQLMGLDVEFFEREAA